MLIKKVLRKIINFASEEDKTPVFYTKDYFNGKKFIIGEFTYGKPKVLFDNADINLTIGKYCSIAEAVTIFLGGNHRIDWITTYPFNVFHADKIENMEKRSATKGSVIIGNDVWIGFGSTILSGVTIGNGAVIAACSVVTKDIGPYEIWGGNPAKILKKRFSEENIERLLNINWWDWDHDKVIDNLENLCSENITEFMKQINNFNES